jgi:hypothetical protein
VREKDRKINNRKRKIRKREDERERENIYKRERDKVRKIKR